MVREGSVWNSVRGADRVPYIPLMALWSAAVNKVEKQSRGSQSRPIEREGVKRLRMRRKGGKDGARVQNKSLRFGMGSPESVQAAER